MKIIEGLKKIKDLTKKAEDLRGKIQAHCADMDHENPVYGTPSQQEQQISEWVQAHSDIVKEILSLRFRIQKTNVNLDVTIELGDKRVTKKIAEWIHRRRDLAALDMAGYKVLSDRGLPAVAQIKQTSGNALEVKIRRYYNPRERDQKLELYRSEPSTIDANLEVVNATMDLME